MKLSMNDAHNNTISNSLLSPTDSRWDQVGSIRRISLIEIHVDAKHVDGCSSNEDSIKANQMPIVGLIRCNKEIAR